MWKYLLSHFSTFKIEKTTKIKIIKDQKLTLENNFIKYKFNKNGNLISAYDKEIKKQLMQEPGNIISLYEDRPNNWDAWDIDFFYRDMLLENASVNNFSCDSSGPVKDSIDFTYLNRAIINKPERFHLVKIVKN